MQKKYYENEDSIITEYLPFSKVETETPKESLDDFIKEKSDVLILTYDKTEHDFSTLLVSRKNNDGIHVINEFTCKEADKLYAFLVTKETTKKDENLNILIIEDDKTKYDRIVKALRKVLSNPPSIYWKQSKNLGLLSFKHHNITQTDKPIFHMVITDNYLPCYDDGCNIKPFGKNIVDEIRRIEKERTTIIVCSSDFNERCDYDYKIDYYSGMDLEMEFSSIFQQMNDG